MKLKRKITNVCSHYQFLASGLNKRNQMTRFSVLLSGNVSIVGIMCRTWSTASQIQL